MPLYSSIQDLVSKFTFISRVKMDKGIIYFFYLKNGKEVSKHLPYRANREQLLKIIERIKDDCGYDEIKKERDEKSINVSPQGFAYTYPVKKNE